MVVSRSVSTGSENSRTGLYPVLTVTAAKAGSFRLIQRNGKSFSAQLGTDGWMTCDFTSFSTVFQSYQDDVRMIMKGCVQWNSVYG